MVKKINYIKLVVLDKEGNAKEDKNGNFEVETHFTPNFIPFRKIYEATDIMEGTSEDGSELTEKEMFKRMTDFVVDVYNNQFTSDDLLDRLHAPDAIEEIQSQVQFIAQGQMDEQRKKAISEDDLNKKVITWAEHKQNLKKVAYDMMKEGGKDINDILDMPFSFFMDVVEDGRKPVKQVDKKDSMLDAFTNL